MSKYRLPTRQFLRFCTVGMVNTSIDLLSFYLLLLFYVPIIPAQVLSYLAGVSNSFLFNRKWTFQVSSKISRMEIQKFLIVNLLALLISVGILYGLYELCKLHLWLSKVASIGGGIVVNFLGSRLWVFDNHQHTRSDRS